MSCSKMFFAVMLMMAVTRWWWCYILDERPWMIMRTTSCYVLCLPNRSHDDDEKGLFTYYVSQNQGFLDPPSPSRNGQLLAYPPPAADVICERPLIVKRESAAEVENMRIPNPTFKDLLVASAVVRAAGERHNRAIKGYTRRHKAAPGLETEAWGHQVNCFVADIGDKTRNTGPCW